MTGPTFAYPLMVRGGAFVCVETGSRRNLEDRAEVTLRTHPGTLDHDPDFGLRDLVGTLGPTAPAILEAVSNVVTGGGWRFDATEDVSRLGERVRTVALELARDEG